MKQPDPDPKLEQWLDARLKKLPHLAAPPALVPTVIAQLKMRSQRAWWSRVWWDWPVQAKVASILLALTLLGAIGGGSVLLNQPVNLYSEEMTERLSPVTAVAETGATLWYALVQVVRHPLVLTALWIGCAGYLLCIGMGTLLVRSIWKRATRTL